MKHPRYIGAMFNIVLLAGIGESRSASVPLPAFIDAGDDGHFMAQTSDTLVWLGSNRMKVMFKGSGRRLEIQFPGARNKSAEAADGTGGNSLRIVGRDASLWRRSPHYARVRFRSIYPGIGLVYYTRGAELEFDFECGPEADASLIRLRFIGADRVAVDDHGSLSIQTGNDIVRLHAPEAWQGSRAGRRAVPAKWIIAAHTQATLQLGVYDRRAPLIIDPTVTYATYLSGSNGDAGRALALDTTGAIFVAGTTTSPDFPNTTAPGGVVLRPPFLASSDAFLVKISADGSRIEYALYLGGSGPDEALFVSVDGQGNALLGGYTESFDFPTTIGTVLRNERYCAFVARVNKAGTDVTMSTLLPITGKPYFGVDAAGNIFAAGIAGSAFAATPGAYQATSAGAPRGAAMKIDSLGTRILYATYLNQFRDITTGFNEIRAMAVSEDGKAYVAGGSHGDVVVLDPSGSRTVFERQLTPGAGIGTTLAQAVALDRDGTLVVAGRTADPNFPLVHPIAPKTKDGNHGFLIKLGADGADVRFSSLFGGQDAHAVPTDSISFVVIDKDGVIDSVGAIPLDTSPLVPGAGFPITYPTVLRLSADGALIQRYRLGQWINVSAIATGSDAGLWLTGTTYRDVLWTSPGAIQRQGAMRYSPETYTDAFLMRVIPENPIPTLHGVQGTVTRLPVGEVGPEIPATVRLMGEELSGDATVYCQGSQRIFSVVSSTELSVQLTAADLGTAGPLRFSVRNGPPGGGESNEVSTPIANPTPQTFSFESGDYLYAGSSKATVILNGREINDTTQVEWNGQIRPARLLEPGNRLEISLDSTELAEPRQNGVRLVNPPPGGGRSERKYFEVRNRTLGDNLIPWIYPTIPAIDYGERDVLSVAGYGFSPKATVYWNGAPLPTAVYTLSVAKFPVEREQTLHPGISYITLKNPASTSNVSLALIPLPEALYAPYRRPIWVYRHSDGLIYGIGTEGDLVSMNPRSGEVAFVMRIAQDVRAMGIDEDGAFLYAWTVDRVWQLDLKQRVVVRDFLAPGLSKPARILPMPGQPETIVAASYDAVAVFDRGVRRPYDVPIPAPDGLHYESLTNMLVTDDRRVVALTEEGRAQGCVWVSVIGTLGLYPFEQQCAGKPGSDFVYCASGLCTAGTGKRLEPLSFAYAKTDPFAATINPEERRLYSATSVGQHSFLVMLQAWDLDRQQLLNSFDLSLLALTGLNPDDKLVQTGPREFLLQVDGRIYPIAVPDQAALEALPRQ